MAASGSAAAARAPAALGKPAPAPGASACALDALPTSLAEPRGSSRPKASAGGSGAATLCSSSSMGVASCAAAAALGVARRARVGRAFGAAAAPPPTVLTLYPASPSRASLAASSSSLRSYCSITAWQEGQGMQVHSFDMCAWQGAGGIWEGPQHACLCRARTLPCTI